MKPDKPLKKPLLRGYFHQEAFYFAFGACVILIAKSTSKLALIASLIYSAGLILMFGISAIYHRPHWQPKSRALLKRLDHAAIFILIASTTTPIFLMTLGGQGGNQFLIVMWTFALFGILQSVFWVTAPKFITAALYVIMGWLALPYVTELKNSLGIVNISLIVIGGVIYTMGAVFYALKKPKLWPRVFGYHEVFHVCTIIGAALHFIVIFKLVT